MTVTAAASARIAPPKIVTTLVCFAITPPKSASSPNMKSANGFTAIISLFLKTCHDSAKSRVFLSAALIDPLDLSICLSRSPNSKRPSRIAAAMSGPARCPNVSMASLFASPAEPAPLMAACTFASALTGSAPALDSLPRPILSPDITASVLTPSFSHLPKMASASSKEKPN